MCVHVYICVCECVCLRTCMFVDTMKYIQVQSGGFVDT